MISLKNEVLSMARARFGSEPEYLWARYPTYSVLRHPNGKWYATVMTLPKSKLGLPEEGSIDVMNVKCDPMLGGALRMQPGFFPAYHMNKLQWITIALDGTVEPEQISVLLDMSYDSVEKKRKSK